MMTFYYDNYQCVVGGRYMPANMIVVKYYDSDTKLEILKKGTNLKYYNGLITGLTKQDTTSYTDKASIDAVLAEFANTETSDNYLYGMMGQSNMKGSGDPDDLPEYLEGNIENCYFLNDSDEWQQLTATNTHSLGYVGPIGEFAYRMSQAYPTKTHYFIMEALGGTNLYSDWKAETGTYYLNFVSKWGMAISKLDNYEVRGLCWGQGVSDANVLIRSINYEQREIDFIQSLKSLTGSKVFISANLHDSLTAPYIYADTIRTAKTNNNSNLYTNGLIDTDSFQLQGDNIHFTTDGYIDLGLAFYNLI